ncbi:MAG: ABC-F family ATP-binding cassette domain-containing protein [Spirochaetales bacterium]|nr:ABC-F family ATP-binding cassette domain-containing protein [Spirochaetales bacterium]
MSFIQLTGIHLSYGERTVLDDINLQFDKNSRVAVTGGNGSGKSSLLKIAASLLKADSGTVVTPKNCRVSYLPQWGIAHKGKTLFAEIETAYDYLSGLMQEKEQIETALAESTEGSSETERLLHRLHETVETIENSTYYRRRETIGRITNGLGFSARDLDRQCGEFSGGWQMRIALAKILVAQADILLLDEPTNYLDLEARNWLESFFHTCGSGIAVVSHDRFFLDSTVRETLELWNGKARRYKGNYSEYEKRRAQELETILHIWDKQQKEIAKTEEFINRFRATASKASLVQSKINHLERMERVEIPENFKKIHFGFPQPPHSGRDVLTIRGLGKAYGELKVFSDLDLDVGRGDRIVITGVNGAGKTTLLRILAGRDKNYTGSVKTGTDVSIGYFAQDSLSQVNGQHSIIEELESEAPTSLVPQLRDILGGFLFRGDDIYKQIAVLSGGEISRICLIKLLLKDINLLILDEPTNHLDIHSKDILLDALQNYSGTLLFVSHDRYFIEKLAGKVLEIENGRALLYPGDYEYYQWKKTGGQTDDTQPAERTSFADTLPGPNTMSGLSYEQQKQLRGQLKKLERRETELLERIEAGEVRKQELTALLSLPENYSNPEKAAELQRTAQTVAAEIERLHQQWEEVSAELEAMNA